MIFSSLKQGQFRCRVARAVHSSKQPYYRPLILSILCMKQMLYILTPKPWLKYAFSTFIDKNKKVKKRKCKKIEAKQSFLSLHPNANWGFSGDRTFDQHLVGNSKIFFYKFASTFFLCFFVGKTLKRIFNQPWGAQHPNAVQNIQQTD